MTPKIAMRYFNHQLKHVQPGLVFYSPIVIRVALLFPMISAFVYDLKPITYLRFPQKNIGYWQTVLYRLISDKCAPKIAFRDEMWIGLISDGLYWNQQRQEQSRSFHQTEKVNGLLQAVQHWFIMKYFFQAIFYAYFVAAFDKSSVNPTRGT